MEYFYYIYGITAVIWTILLGCMHYQAYRLYGEYAFDPMFTIEEIIKSLALIFVPVYGTVLLIWFIVVVSYEWITE